MNYDEVAPLKARIRAETQGRVRVTGTITSKLRDRSYAYTLTIHDLSTDRHYRINSPARWDAWLEANYGRD